MKAVDAVTSLLGAGNPSTIEQQKQAVVETIKAGRENNADEFR
jgi:hypothetical protein